MGPDVAADPPGGCTGHGPVVAHGSPAVRKREPRRLSQEGAVTVAIMISNTRGQWHKDMIRCATERPRGEVRHRNEALGLHELECRRLQASTLSGFLECLCQATAASAECRVALCLNVTTAHGRNASRQKFEKHKNNTILVAATRFYKSLKMPQQNKKLESHQARLAPVQLAQHAEVKNELRQDWMSHQHGPLGGLGRFATTLVASASSFSATGAARVAKGVAAVIVVPSCRRGRPSHARDQTVHMRLLRELVREWLLQAQEAPQQGRRHVHVQRVVAD